MIRLTLRDIRWFPCSVTESITTRQVVGSFTLANDIILATTKVTRILFRPSVHDGGVRGEIVRQKVGRGGVWKDVSEVNFTTMPADCGVRIDLDTEAIRLLFLRLGQLYEIQRQGVSPGEQRYVVGKEGETLFVPDLNKASAIRNLLDAGYSQDFWTALIESDSDLATRLAIAKVQLDRQDALREFETSLREHASDEAYWQAFFGGRPWMLENAFSAAVMQLRGETYVGGKKAGGRQGAGGVATDFLFSDESTKSFAVVDIKTPSCRLVGRQYRGRKSQKGMSLDNNVIYMMHGELSGAIVQVRNQIAVAVENFGLVLGKSYLDLNSVHPSGVLVVGAIAGLSEREKSSFNHFRHGLHGLTVITFDELLKRLKLIFGDVTIPRPRRGTPIV
jgi:hypothetical protein